MVPAVSTIGVLVRKCTQDEQFMDMVFAEQGKWGHSLS